MLEITKLRVRRGARAGWQTTKNLAVISRPSGLWMRQFPRLPLCRRRCSLYARLFDSRAPTTFYPLIFAVLSLLLLFLLFLLPLPPVSTHHAPSNLLLPSFSTPPSSPPFPRPFISRCLIFLVGLSSTPNHGSLHRTIAAESFRLEISTMRLSTALPAIPIACISPLQPLRYIIPGRATHPIQAGARIDREKEDSSRGINFSAILSLSFSAGRGNGHRRIFYAGGELELGWKEEWWGEGVAESLMKILAGGVRKAGEKGVARLLAAREARTKMAGNNEAAERTEIPGSLSPRSKQQNVRSIFNCVPGTELSTYLFIPFHPRSRRWSFEGGWRALFVSLAIQSAPRAWIIFRDFSWKISGVRSSFRPIPFTFRTSAISPFE